MLAEAGYLALIADFYGKRPTDFDEAGTCAAEIRPDPLAYRRRLAAALGALATHARGAAACRSRRSASAWAARRRSKLARDGAPLAAAVSFHGLLDTGLPAEPGEITARILVCHGDADPMVPRSQVLAFWEEMDAAGANWHFHSLQRGQARLHRPGSRAGNPGHRPTTPAPTGRAGRRCWRCSTRCSE